MYRIFISYSHEDYQIVKKLVKILKENSLIPLWDEEFRWGHKFPEQIKTFIAHSHVFVPVITNSSSKRGWVHQEIGYALALNIPILPITKGKVPEQMLRDYLPIPWTNNTKALNQKLSLEKFTELVNLQQLHPLFECAQTHEERALMIADYANKVIQLGFYGHVRQMGVLGSFSIPDKPMTHDYWRFRYSPNPPNEFRYRSLLEERQAIEKHAKNVGVV